MVRDFFFLDMLHGCAFVERGKRYREDGSLGWVHTGGFLPGALSALTQDWEAGKWVRGT